MVILHYLFTLFIYNYAIKFWILDNICFQIKNGTSKLNCLSGNSFSILRYLSAQASDTGKNKDLKFNNQTPKPIILPPETTPSTPHPNPIVEIPGFKNKSILSI